MPSRRSQRGNVLVMILITIAVLAALTLAVSRSTSQQSDVLPAQTRDDQINRMLTYASTLGAALHQMTITGADPRTLYADVSLLKPGEAGFETGSSARKLYHPLGGGITPLEASAPDAAAVATDYNINAASIIAGVGPTDSTVGDLVFTAHIATEAACARINEKLSGDAGIPTLATAAFDDLFGGATVTVDSGNCADCVNKAQLCVSNTAATAWGFYAALYPG